MPDNEDKNPLEELLKKRHAAAMEALTFFVSKYSPAATKEEADMFYSTAEISKAVGEHTGFTLDIAEIYELMTNMNYTYEALGGLEFSWLLKK